MDSQTTHHQIPLLAKISLLLFGIFLTSLIFALSLRFFKEAGLWIGLIICVALSFCGFYHIEKGTRLRLITWGLSCTLILGSALYIIGLQILKHNLEKVVQS